MRNTAITFLDERASRINHKRDPAVKIRDKDSAVMSNRNTNETRASNCSNTFITPSTNT